MNRTSKFFVLLFITVWVCAAAPSISKATNHDACSTLLESGISSETKISADQTGQNPYELNLVITGSLEQNPPKELILKPNASVYKISDGYVGGKVFRISYPDGSSEIQKIYGSAEDAALDSLRFKILERAIKRIPNPLDRFTIAKHELLSNVTMKIEDVAGVDLNRFDHSKHIPSGLKAIIHNKYMRFLNQLMVALKEDYPSAYLQQTGMIFLDASKHYLLVAPTHVLFLQKSNIVLRAADHTLFVVDPH